MEIDQVRAAKIAAINDQFRRTLRGGELVVTEAVNRLPDRRQIFNLVREFDDFSEDNDPYGEHDFGSVKHRGKRYFWKIDYYDLDMKLRSREPANPIVTNRVLTIMRADEY
jgi:hypothetical protein